MLQHWRGYIVYSKCFVYDVILYLHILAVGESKGHGQNTDSGDGCDFLDVPTVRFGPKLVCDIGACKGRCTVSLVALGHF